MPWPQLSGIWTDAVQSSAIYWTESVQGIDIVRRLRWQQTGGQDGAGHRRDQQHRPGDRASRSRAEGAHVAVSGRDAERGAAVVAEIGAAGGRADFVAADLDGSAAASRELAERADRRRSAAASTSSSTTPGSSPATTTTATDEETFDRVFAVNVKAPFFLTAAIAPAMAERGEGAIINLGSWVARLGIPVGALYASTKGAIETLTRAWAAEFGPAGCGSTRSRPGVVRAERRRRRATRPR